MKVSKKQLIIDLDDDDLGSDLSTRVYYYYYNYSFAMSIFRVLLAPL